QISRRGENLPPLWRQPAENPLVTVRGPRFSRHITDENTLDLPWILTRKCSVDFRIALAGIADENKATIRKAREQRLDNGALIFLWISEEAKEGLVLPAKFLQREDASRKTV